MLASEIDEAWWPLFGVADAAQPLPPLKGRYRATDYVGAGSIGVVLRGVDETNHRQVAIKLIPQGAAPDAAREQRMISRLQRELTICKKHAGFDHPHIVRVFQFKVGAAVSECFVVMEFIDGVDLKVATQKTCANDGRWAFAKILAIARQCAAGLRYLHGLKVKHRDIKPANILLNAWSNSKSDIHVKITDFGLAKEEDDSGRDISIVAVGTPRYRAPEQGQQEDVPASDLYSLGCVLAELCVPALAVRREPPTADDVPTGDHHDRPAWFLDLVRGLLDSNPATRPSAALACAVIDGHEHLSASPGPVHLSTSVASLALEKVANTGAWDSAFGQLSSRRSDALVTDSLREALSRRSVAARLLGAYVSLQITEFVEGQLSRCLAQLRAACAYSKEAMGDPPPQSWLQKLFGGKDALSPLSHFSARLHSLIDEFQKTLLPWTGIMSEIGKSVGGKSSSMYDHCRDITAALDLLKGVPDKATRKHPKNPNATIALFSAVREVSDHIDQIERSAVIVAAVRREMQRTFLEFLTCTRTDWV
ncbi:MAG: serine/threonine protein kinase [Gemmataceae bacterium]|nr:serine/threonine protein kinase [Gemmataceae bacterium]